MKPEEQADLDVMHARAENFRNSAFNMCRHLLQMDEQALKTCGYKTADEGIVSTIKTALKQVDELGKAHLRKWPD